MLWQPQRQLFPLIRRHNHPGINKRGGEGNGEFSRRTAIAELVECDRDEDIVGGFPSQRWPARASHLEECFSGRC